MNKRQELDMQKFKILKAARAAIRLKHSLHADEEINERIPELERMMDSAIQAGKPLEIDIQTYVEDAK
jgi:hypothetical protein